MSTSDGPLDILAAATATLERIKSLTNQIGWEYVELAGGLIGVGIAVGFGDTQFSVLSVMGGGNENQLSITAGVLRDIQQDRVTALSTCNAMVRDNPAYPIYLHDAPIGWDILVSNVFPVELLVDVPPFFAKAVRALPMVADNARVEFLKAGLGGQPFNWNGEDLNRLLIESMM